MIPSSQRLTQLLKLNITGNTLLKGAVPSGYRIKRIDVSAWGERTGNVLNIGTSVTGTDVVAGHRLDGARMSYDIVVGLRQFPSSHDQSLYVNGAGGDPWDLLSLDLFITLEPIPDGRYS